MSHKEIVCKLPEFYKCQPLSDVRDVFNWRRDEFTKDVKPLCKKTSNSPKTLVCHDMAGGYLQDSYVQGVRSNSCFNFYHWNLIDVFVYFSHHFVTIPPHCWINASHTHGVPILGTIITEWESGSQKCNEFLSSNETVIEMVDKLTNIASFYQFDGYLINIENPVKKEKIPLLIEFCRLLTIKMKSVTTQAVVLWYDSVTSTGELAWQNELNQQNVCFFDVCDGIFLNYLWTDETLAKSRTVSESYSRVNDVFVGVDVFGRKCYGGGGFNTYTAVKKACDFQLSTAIFAPGWIYECCDKVNFEENTFRFWKSLAPYCHHSQLHLTLPFTTTFCKGQGSRLFKNGKVLDVTPWTNVSFQNIQPMIHQNNSKHGLLIKQNENFVYNGGCSLRISHQDDRPTDGEHKDDSFENFNPSVALFANINIQVSTKSLVFLGVTLHSDIDILPYSLNLLTDLGSLPILLTKVDHSIHIENELFYQSVLKSTIEEMISRNETSLECVESTGWTTRFLTLPENVKEIYNLQITFDETSQSCKDQLYIGQIQFFTQEDLAGISISNVKWHDQSKRDFTANRSGAVEPNDFKDIDSDLAKIKGVLSWETSKSYRFANIYICNDLDLEGSSKRDKFIGQTTNNYFVLTNLATIGNQRSTFIIEVVSNAGFACQKHKIKVNSV